MSSEALDKLSERIANRSARVGVIGLGYVGLPLAVELASAGFEVIGFDIDATKIAAIEAGNSYIGDVSQEQLLSAREGDRFRATTDFEELHEVEVVNVCVPTPLTKTKDPDVSFMASAVEAIRDRLHPGRLIILGSTTYPGTTRELFVPVLEETGLKVGSDFSLAFAPERIDPGNTQFKVKNVPKVVGGETEICTDLACQLFNTVFETTVPVSSTQAAEMVKLLENTFRAINIGLANEIALMCERLDLDVWEVIEAAATKPYGFMKFLPGPGLGGHCIPVDPSYLSWRMKSLNFSARFIELATEINSGMPAHVVDRVADVLNGAQLAINGARILVIGVAYKSDVSDMRESPAIDVISLLARKGARISYHDPFVPDCEIDGVRYQGEELSDELLGESDLVLILTDHRGIDYERLVAKSSRVFDTRNATQHVQLEDPDWRARVTKL
ncbi:MAG TPA: nucleotide sugar dehydrogenase [Myxococcales bacterium]|nr:nucleotide sugar dehydrogenase [Myxococcales bacterium]HIL01301.1 nucleotide sugar dehydrogenase [Myxococcales bacterium]